MARPAFDAHRLGSGRITEIGTICHACYFRQKSNKGAYRRRFACTSSPTEQHTTNRGVDSVQQQGKLHVLLSNHGAQWECNHASLSFTGVGYREGCSSFPRSPPEAASES